MSEDGVFDIVRAVLDVVQIFRESPESQCKRDAWLITLPSPPWHARSGYPRRIVRDSNDAWERIMAVRRGFMLARRSFLAHASMTTLGAGASSLLPTRATAATTQDDDVGVIQTALALEHEGIAAYQIAGKSGLLSPGTLKLALVFLGHHQAHRDSLAKLVADAGGRPVEPKSDAHYIEALKLGSLKTEADVVALATTLEHGAASAYIGQIAALRDPRLAQLFAKLSADEAVHWTTLNNAAGTPIPAAAYLFG